MALLIEYTDPELSQFLRQLGDTHPSSLHVTKQYTVPDACPPSTVRADASPPEKLQMETSLPGEAKTRRLYPRPDALTKGTIL